MASVPKIFSYFAERSLACAKVLLSGGGVFDVYASALAIEFLLP